ncbi:MAG: hypothetical protein K6E54_03565 [Bacteroidaceae bacterium]|nr:hypothetical protein [Bacteroidaceae bacterium]
MYLGGANTNGTQASLIKYGQPIYLIKKSDNTFALDTKMFSSSTSHYLGTNLYMDSEIAYWTFTEISEGTYALSCEENKYLAYDGNSTTLTTTDNYNSNASQWKVISEEERLSSLKAGSDATFIIRDANFSKNMGPAYGQSYWTVGNVANPSDLIISSGNSTNNCASAYHTTFDTYQILKNIPNGTYTLNVQGFYRLDAGRAAYIPEFYVDEELETFLPSTNGESTVNDACTSFTLDMYNTKIVFNVLDGRVTIGTRLEKNMNIWCCWDNMRLTYTKELDQNLNEKAYELSMNAAKEAQELYMNKDIKQKLDSWIDHKYVAESCYDSLDSYIRRLNKLTGDAFDSADIYENVKNHYNMCDSLDESGKQIFKELAADIYASYTEQTITNGIREIETLDSLYNVAYLQQTTPGTDMTKVIVNPTIDGSTGWITEIPNGGNGPLLNNTSFEYWGGGSLDEEERSFNYYQTVNGLQNGKYTVTCEAYNSMNNVEYGFSKSSGIYATSGGITVKTYVDEDSETLKEYTTPEIHVTDGTLTFGVRNFNTMVARWFVADNFKLTLAESDVTSIVEVNSHSNQVIKKIYSLDGVERSKMSKGINIIKYSNGTTKKVYIK